MLALMDQAFIQPPASCGLQVGLMLKLGRYIRSSQKVCLGVVIEAAPGSAECPQKIFYFVMKCRTALRAPKLLSCFQMSNLLFEPALAVRVGAAQWEGIGVRHIHRLCHFDNVQSDSHDVTVRIPPRVEDFDRFEKCNNDCIQRHFGPRRNGS
jgi:hypothetical protein